MPTKKKRKVKKDADWHPDVRVERYKEGEKWDNVNAYHELLVESVQLNQCEYVVAEKVLLYLECYCEKKINYVLDASEDRSLGVGIKLECKKCRNLMTVTF